MPPRPISSSSSKSPNVRPTSAPGPWVVMLGGVRVGVVANGELSVGTPPTGLGVAPCTTSRGPGAGEFEGLGVSDIGRLPSRRQQRNPIYRYQKRQPVARNVKRK